MRTLLICALCALGGASMPAWLAAQLRPYDPLDWDVFDQGHRYLAAVGGSFLAGQRASLAGTEGDLLEVGSFRAVGRSNRIAVDASGIIFRTLEEDHSFAEPLPPTDAGSLRRRSDSGDYRIATTVMLTRPGRAAAIALRFGTRLPTTDNRVGLERDQTDFFGLVAARYDYGPVRTTAEAGVGLHGTREPDFEQSDVLIYSIGASRRSGLFRPGIHIVGHADGLPDRAIRGNEELSELRLQLRVGTDRWLDLQLVRGLVDFSPSGGLMLSVGWTG